MKTQLENILNHKVNNQVSNSSLELKTQGFSCSKDNKMKNFKEFKEEMLVSLTEKIAEKLEFEKQAPSECIV